jgi:hypothetical protein
VALVTIAASILSPRILPASRMMRFHPPHDLPLDRPAPSDHALPTSSSHYGVELFIDSERFVAQIWPRCSAMSSTDGAVAPMGATQPSAAQIRTLA